jgi:acyl-CoA reductase-like NAD-dependent aldehyde dehydrogenase
VHDSLHDAFVAALAKRVDAVEVMGDPLDEKPQTSARSSLRSSRRQGAGLHQAWAKPLAGAKAAEMLATAGARKSCANGLFVQPVIFTGIRRTTAACAKRKSSAR